MRLQMVAFLVLASSLSAYSQAPAGKPAFEDKGPQIGQQLPNLEIRTLEDDPRELHSVLRYHPLTVLVTASYTCPKSRSTYPAIRELERKYKGKVQFIILYVIEAHPQTDICPYTGKEDVTEENVRDGILRRQPKTQEQRIKLAQEFKQTQNVTAEIYLDVMGNSCWKNLGGGPNMAFLVNNSDIVLLRQGWLDAAKLPPAIDAVLQAGRSFERAEDSIEKVGLGDLQIWDVMRTLENGPVADARALLQKHPKLVNWKVPSMKGISGGRTMLGQVVENGKVELAELLIGQGADVNSRGDDGMTALHAAAIGGKAEMVDLLLKDGAKIDAREGSFAGNEYGPTALDESLFHANSDAADRLIKAGATSSFWSDVAMGKLDAVHAALAKDVTFANRPDGLERTPLMYAAVNGQTEVAKVLIEKGAVLHRPKHGRQEPALAWSVRYRHIETARLLLQAGADPNEMSFNLYEAPINLLDPDKPEELPYYKLLIEYKADLSRTNVRGRAPLHQAVTRNNLKMLDLLIAAGADVNQLTSSDRSPCGPRGGDGFTALHLAVAGGNADTVQHLLQTGAKVNQEDATGQTALDHAEDPEIIAILKAAKGKKGSGKEHHSLEDDRRGGGLFGSPE